MEGYGINHGGCKDRAQALLSKGYFSILLLLLKAVFGESYGSDFTNLSGGGLNLSVQDLMSTIKTLTSGQKCSMQHEIRII